MVVRVCSYFSVAVEEAHDGAHGFEVLEATLSHGELLLDELPWVLLLHGLDEFDWHGPGEDGYLEDAALDEARCA